MKKKKQIELYDVGRVICRPFKEGYKFIEEHGKDYIKNTEVLNQIITWFTERKGTISQDIFNYINETWVRGFQDGRLILGPNIVYPDVETRFKQVKKDKKEIQILTSGSQELTDILLGDNMKYVAKVLVGSESGDKAEGSTYENILLNENIVKFLDDKPANLVSAKKIIDQNNLETELFLVDRLDKIASDAQNQYTKQRMIYVKSFNEVTSYEMGKTGN